MITKGKVLLICGPTAAGKTNLGVELALKYNGEVISADSRQFYREMNIGTAKPRKDELRGIPHHFIDSHSIKTPISAGQFAREATTVISEILHRKRLPVIVGGSGLYIDALLEGLDELPKDEVLRTELNLFFEKKGLPGLTERLKKADPKAEELIDIKNPMRIMRALELIILKKQPLHEIRSDSNRKGLLIPTIGICIAPDRKELYRRINERVDHMVESGLVQEAENLIEYENIEVLQTVGYRELFPYLHGRITLEKAVELIKRNSRRYAKRQLTWFKKKDYLKWFDPAEKSEVESFLDKLLK